ncbi:hypothetical protein MJN51_38900, partial [Salmonella enterica subsp. enterica serovar Kentucky]|nr:hypothetical protein [Salmonella enterica subsp. enterica serovar Kentucky]
PDYDNDYVSDMECTGMTYFKWLSVLLCFITSYHAYANDSAVGASYPTYGSVLLRASFFL